MARFPLQPPPVHPLQPMPAPALALARHASRALVPLAFAAGVLPPSVSLAETLNGVPVVVLSRSTTALSNGSLTFVRISPPALPPPPPPPVHTAPEPSAEELATEARRAAKEHRTLALTAITYAGTPTVTELSWTRQEDGRRFVAYSPVDFTHLTQLQDIETSSGVYLYCPFVSPGDPAELAPGVREALAAAAPADSGAPPAYLFMGEEADLTAEADTLELLDTLHAIWHTRAEQLVADTARRQAEAVERERQAALEAARPKHDTILFWKAEDPEPSASAASSSTP